MSIAKRVLNKAARATKTFVKSRVSESVVILNYHRVNNPTALENNLTVSIESFREQMQVLRDHFVPTRLKDLEDEGPAFQKKNNNRKTRVVVTFDDGYADTFLNALPILEECNVPGTVFVTTNFIGTKKEFWWDELEELLVSKVSESQMPSVLELVKDVVSVKKDLSRGELYLNLAAAMKAKGEPIISHVMSNLRIIANSEPVERDEHRAMTVEELRSLAKNPLIEIGAHTVSHPSLAGLDRQNQYQEMKQSKEWLEQTLGLKVNNIAYPFGQPQDFNHDTVSVAEELGFKLGLTTVSAVTFPKNNPYTLPRMFVQDWKGDEFKRRLSRLANFG